MENIFSPFKKIYSSIKSMHQKKEDPQDATPSRSKNMTRVEKRLRYLYRKEKKKMHYRSPENIHK